MIFHVLEYGFTMLSYIQTQNEMHDTENSKLKKNTSDDFERDADVGIWSWISRMNTTYLNSNEHW